MRKRDGNNSVEQDGAIFIPVCFSGSDAAAVAKNVMRQNGRGVGEGRRGEQNGAMEAAAATMTK